MSANWAALSRPRLVDEVVQVLRAKIIRGELPPGTQLLQIELAEQLGVSRTPLREAFRILENDGLLKTSNNNRTVEVVTFTAADLRAMYEVREVVDGLAARLTATRGLSPADEAEARRLLAEMERTSKPHEPLDRVEAHAAFHAFFLERSGNTQLHSLVPLVRTSSAALHLPFLDSPETVQLPVNGTMKSHKDLLDETQESHLGILEAVLAGKGAHAEKVARRHIVRTLQFVDDFDEWRRIATEASHGPDSARSGPRKR